MTAYLRPGYLSGVQVNGTDLATYRFVRSEAAGLLDPAVGRPPSVAAPGVFGERATGAAALVPPRRVTFDGTVIATSAATYDQAVRDLLAFCAGGADGTTSEAVTLAVAPAPGVAPAVRRTAYLAAETTVRRAGDSNAGAVTLVFEALDPVAVDVSETSVSLSTTIARCALGSVRSNPVISLAGPFTSRVVTLKDGADVVRGTLTITAPASTVLTGHTVEIDTAASTVTWVHGGVRDARAAWLVAGDFVWLRPQHVVGGVNPGLVLDAGAGSVTYRKAYR